MTLRPRAFEDPTIRVRLRLRFYEWLFSGYPWTTLHDVVVIGPQSPEGYGEVLESLARALDLIHEVHIPTLRRLTAVSRFILIQPVPGWCGGWSHGFDAIVLDPESLASRSDLANAATIVHEAAHGRLSAAGVGYQAPIRERVEAICARREASFLRRVPESAEHAELLERARPYFAPESTLFGRDVATARASGVPTPLAWLAAAVGRVSRL